MTRLDVDRATDVVGSVTFAMGAALTVAPRRTARWLGLGDHARFARGIGVADLVLAPGLFRGRPRWPWVAARTALNLVIARHYFNESRQPSGDSTARYGAMGMLALTAVDGALALRLRRSEQATRSS
ncbi:hypothetical protein [Phytoactinopolyspora mesophila]|uniref:Uncharacterized protein n=1 Tax=Phytoactinopolyspora mesophila TaxID=2650750 RepID=A0A7K3MA26_9ACTN|nr:hypothetical protein [Phytoactinopolyspora mesophila]NDL60143.1 hypothetical protein [Phytoactinopolyspora mesophila]